MKRLIFLIVGVALIVFAFVILVNETPWPKQIWLDLCVVILVYGFNVLSSSWFNKSIPQFRSMIPSLGILWVSVGLYSLFSILGLYCAHKIPLLFEISLIIQLVLLFIFLSFVMLSAEANRKAKDVQQVESRTLESIDKLRSTFNVGSSSTSILEKNYPELLREIQSIGSDLRYLSPLPGRTAHELEMKIQVEMEILFDALRCGSGTDLELQIKQIRESANKICDFIKVRKECKNNQDLQEM